MRAGDPAKQAWLSILHVNVTLWGPGVEGFLLGSVDHIILVCETHLPRDKSDQVLKRWRRAGYRGLAQPAFPTGRSAMGLAAGILILTKEDLCAVPVDADLVESICPDRRRWCAVVVRRRSVSLLLVEAYLVSGLGMTGRT